ncbi:hypothetical protein WR25_15489 [Diploscapter pachys]|uniref:HTH CENPB-type domain-containing protein n=1 Tax=Diploscapter pachys TaxID=2018661 RepID=A0A2A2J438_9BILA|nr:hypothetical protein WR25_15489 [Diploscapter pachys]
MPCLPANVLRLLYSKFGISDENAQITEAEIQLADRIEHLLRRHEKEDVVTAEIGISVGTAKNKKLSNEATDPDYRPEREKQGPPKPIELPSPEQSQSDKIDFSGRWISKADVERALAYYRGTKKRTRSIESMNHRFKWIKDKHHITKLLKFEKQGAITPTKRVGLTNVQDELHKRVQAVMSGREELLPSVHDLRKMAKKIAEEHSIANFSASPLWITSYPIRVVPKAGEGKWPVKKKRPKTGVQVDQNGEGVDASGATTSSPKRRKATVPHKNSTPSLGTSSAPNPHNITLHNMDNHRPHHSMPLHQQNNRHVHQSADQFVEQQQDLQAQAFNNFGQIIDNDGNVLYYMNNQSNRGIYSMAH